MRDADRIGDDSGRSLLSTSAATIVEVCAVPATVAAGKAGSRPLPTAAQAPGGLIEKLQP